MAAQGLEELFKRQLHVLYGEEKESRKVLGKMAKAAESPGLRKELESHALETEEHLKRLETIFEQIGVKPSARSCRRVTGLLEDCEATADAGASGSAHDAALIAQVQHVEHEEMAAYGCARTWARLLNHKSAADLLQKTLEEEHAADKRLTEIAEDINQHALAGAPG